jgi:LPXTG-motif cell wall-anchored protein
VSFGGVAVSILVLTGGFAVAPAAALAQAGAAPDTPVAAATASPAAVSTAPEPPSTPAGTAEAKDLAARSGCAQPAEEPATGLDADSTTLPADPADPATSSGEVEDVPPVAHCSQNAGDEQYQDPFGNSKPPKAGSKTPQSSTQQSGGRGTATPASVLAQQSTDPATAGAAARAGDSAGKLPNTGLDARLPGVLGLALLLSGGALRRRHA